MPTDYQLGNNWGICVRDALVAVIRSAAIVVAFVGAGLSGILLLIGLIFYMLVTPPHREPISDDIIIQFYAANQAELDTIASKITDSSEEAYCPGWDVSELDKAPDDIANLIRSNPDIPIQCVYRTISGITIIFDEVVHWVSSSHLKSLVFPEPYNESADEIVIHQDTNLYMRAHHRSLRDNDLDYGRVIRPLGNTWYIKHELLSGWP